MAASKRGRGAKAAGSAKPTDEASSASDPLEESNGAEEAVAETEQEVGEGGEEAAESGAGDCEPAGEPVPAAPAESGKLLVENLPSSLLFEYQEKLRELFSPYGEVVSVKRGPIVVTELTTTPTLSAFVEFKSKDSLEKAVSEHGRVVDGVAIAVAAQPSTVDTTVLVGAPLEASDEYVRLLFSECGEVAQIREFSRTKHKILRVTYASKESLEKALKLDRELRINGFLVTVNKYREDEEQRAFNVNNKTANKRQHQQTQNRNSAPLPTLPAPAPRNNYRGRGAFAGAPVPFRGRGGRGGFVGRGSTFVRGGGGYRGRGVNNFMSRGGFMGRGMHHQM